MAHFSEQVVLITGASGGLGQAVAAAFAHAGAQVVGVARSANSTDRLRMIAADLAQPGEAARVVREAGRIDCVVHVMGGFAGGTPVHETDDATWHHMMNINLNSAFYLFRAALPPLLARQHGRLIAVSSRAGVDPVPTLSAYGVSKAALNMLIRTLAAELKDTGVTANAVLPSTINTAQNRSGMPDGDAARWVRPEAIADLVLYLASESAQDINGALIPIYGRS